MEAYFAASERLRYELRPYGEFENKLVQSLADAQWQLDRARAIETNILFASTLKHIDFADSNQDEKREPNNVEPSHRPTTSGPQNADWALGQADAFLEHAKQLDLISRYASRYHRQVLQIHDRLVKVQKERKKEEYERSKNKKQRNNQQFAGYQQATAKGASFDGRRETRQHHEAGLTKPASDASAQQHTANLGFVSQPATQGPNPGRHGRDSFAPLAPERSKTLKERALEALAQNKKKVA